MCYSRLCSPVAKNQNSHLKVAGANHTFEWYTTLSQQNLGWNQTWTYGSQRTLNKDCSFHVNQIVDKMLVFTDPILRE